jgi:hypothetical protein
MGVQASRLARASIPLQALISFLFVAEDNENYNVLPLTVILQKCTKSSTSVLFQSIGGILL